MNRVELINLYDTYEVLLTSREQEIFKYYYYEDLSLSEIGDNLNITRTGVHNTLKKVEEKLNNYEENLHLYSIKQTLNNILKEKNLTEIKQQIKKIVG